MRYVVNINFNGNKQGEVVAADPELVATYVDAGFLSPIDDTGERLSDAPSEPEDEAEPVPEQQATTQL